MDFEDEIADVLKKRISAIIAKHPKVEAVREDIREAGLEPVISEMSMEIEFVHRRLVRREPKTRVNALEKQDRSKLSAEDKVHLRAMRITTDDQWPTTSEGSD